MLAMLQPEMSLIQEGNDSVGHILQKGRPILPLDTEEGSVPSGDVS